MKMNKKFLLKIEFKLIYIPAQQFEHVIATFEKDDKGFRCVLKGSFEDINQVDFEHEFDGFTFQSVFNKFLETISEFQIGLGAFKIINIDASIRKLYVKFLIDRLHHFQYESIDDKVIESFENHLKIKLKRIKKAKKLDYSEVCLTNSVTGSKEYIVGKINLVDGLMLIYDKKDKIKATFTVKDFSIITKKINSKYVWYFDPIC